MFLSLLGKWLWSSMEKWRENKEKLFLGFFSQWETLNKRHLMNWIQCAENLFQYYKQNKRILCYSLLSLLLTSSSTYFLPLLIKKFARKNINFYPKNKERRFTMFEVMPLYCVSSIGRRETTSKTISW